MKRKLLITMFGLLLMFSMVGIAYADCASVIKAWENNGALYVYSRYRNI